MEFAKHIEKMRRYLSLKHFKKDRLKGRPTWTYFHDMKTQYKEQSKLINGGNVYYAALVQANINIFRSGNINCGAVILFSTDLYYDSNPEELAELAQMIFNLKDESDYPEDLEYFAKLIKDELRYFFNIKLPLFITNNREVYITTLIIHRHHLPNRKLTSNIFPIIAKPEELSACMILPCHYWTDGFKKRFEHYF